MLLPRNTGGQHLHAHRLPLPHAAYQIAGQPPLRATPVSFSLARRPSTGSSVCKISPHHQLRSSSFSRSAAASGPPSSAQLPATATPKQQQAGDLQATTVNHHQRMISEMSGARERILKKMGKTQPVRKLAGDQSGAGPIAPGTSTPSPNAVLVSPGARTPAGKRAREAEILDLTRETEKSKYEFPPCHLKKEFFSSASLAFPAAELVHLEGLDRPTKRAQLAADASAIVRVLGMTFVYAEESSSQERELRKLKEDNAALEGKVKILEEAGVEQDKVKRSLEEKVKLLREKLKDTTDSLDSSLAERKAAEDLIEKLRVEMAPSAEESDEQKSLMTRAELIARINQADADNLAVVEEVFDSVIAQIKVANPGVELNLEGVGSANSVVDGKIVAPDFMIEDRHEVPDQSAQ